MSHVGYVPENDRQFWTAIVTKVEPSNLPNMTGWFVTDREGWSLYVTNEHCKQAPVPGEAMRRYGRGIGYMVRGIVIGGRVYRYQTAEELANDHH